jgi:hypothetical protein
MRTTHSFVWGNGFSLFFTMTCILARRVAFFLLHSFCGVCDKSDINCATFVASCGNFSGDDETGCLLLPGPVSSFFLSRQPALGDGCLVLLWYG